MTGPALDALRHVVDYSARLQAVLQKSDWSGVVRLAETLRDCWVSRRQVFLCGNGGSAGNAIHLANDFIYGISKRHGSGLRAIALPANPAVLTCLANDTGYDEIFAKQLAVQGTAGDVLVVLSGSGNSPNILRSLEEARAMGMTSFAVLGYGGGKAKTMADCAIHFPIDDMQVAEDLQLVVGHMVMQWLYANQPEGA
ncbi:MAG: SIS domain-containing protein [Burkholderiales bacterium]